MKWIRYSVCSLALAAAAPGCGSSDDDSSENENQGTGGGSGASEIDERCALSHCPNDATAYDSQECEGFIIHPCFSAWQEDMACYRQNEVCDPDGTANADSVRTCKDNARFEACVEAMFGGGGS